MAKKKSGADLTPPPPFDEISTAEAVDISGQIIKNDLGEFVPEIWDRWTQDLIEMGYLDGSGNITDSGRKWLENAY